MVIVRQPHPRTPGTALWCWLAAMFWAMYSASLPTPPISADVIDVEEVPAYQVQAGLGRHPTFVHRLPVVVEDREFDPSEVRPEPGAPDHVRHIDDTAVLDDRGTAADSVRSRHSLDPSGGEVFRVHPLQRRRLGQHLRPNLPPDRRADGEHSGGQEPDKGSEEPVPHTFGVDGEVTDVRPGQPGRVGGGDLECDLGAGVARTHHEDPAVAQLSGVGVLAGMQRHDPRIELRGELGNPGQW